MKKLFCLLMTMLVIAIGLLPGYAEGMETVNLNQVKTNETAASLCFIEDALYILGNHGVYMYDDNQLTIVINFPDMYMHRYNPIRPEDEDQAAQWDKAISHIFTDGTALYGLHPYTGMVFEIVDGQLKERGQLSTDLLYVSDEDLHREIKGAVFAGGKLALLLGTDNYEEYDKTEIVLADLSGQTVEVSAVDNAKSIAAGEDGKLLVYIEDEQGAAVWKYDMDSDALEEAMMTFEAGASPSGLQGFGQSAVYLGDSRVMVTDGKGGATVKAYLPVQYANTNAPAACSEKSMYAYGYGNYVFVRDISGEGEADQIVLTVMGNVNPQTVIDFSVANPNIAVVTRDASDTNSLMAAAVSKDAGVDLFVLPAPGSYASMLKNGYLVPVESTVLMEEAKELYPAIQEIVFSGEQLYGFPVTLSPHCWMLNETKWNEFDLGDAPTTYTDLLEIIDLWIQDYAADYPDYTVAELHQAGLSAFVMSIVEAYIYEYEDSEGQFTFDAPAFRETLEKVAEYAYLFDSENEQWGMAMISSSYLGFGLTYTDNDLNRMMNRPMLSEGEEQKMYAKAEIMAVSAASENKDTAIRFMEFYADNLSVRTKYEMMPSLNEPVVRPNYETRMAELNAQIEELKGQYEKAGEAKEQQKISEMIAGVERQITAVESNRYLISAESIAVYRGMAKQMEISFESAYFGSTGGLQSLSEVVSRFAGDGFEASEIDAMINELNRVAYMVSAESR